MLKIGLPADHPDFRGKVDATGNVLPLTEWTDEGLQHELAAMTKAVEEAERTWRDLKHNRAELMVEKFRRYGVVAKR